MDADIPTAERVSAMSVAEYQAYEDRVRRLARHQGVELRRSRRRDPRQMDHGKYTLVRVEETPSGAWRSKTLRSYGRGMTLREAHRYLLEQDTRRG